MRADALESYTPNDSISLRKGLQLRIAGVGDDGPVGSAGSRESVTGEARLRLLPRPSLELLTKSDAAALPGSQAMEGVLTLAWEHGNQGQFFRTRRRTILGDAAPVVETVWRPSRQPILVRSGCEASASQIHFHVINFPPLFGAGDEFRQNEDGSCSRRGCVRAQADSFRIEIRECGNFREILDELEESRGFGLTHQGRIARVDGKSIDTEEARLLLRALDDFLSFARGTNCSLTLVRALSGDEEVVWEQWGCRRVEPWNRSCSSWFDLQRGQILGEAFSCFWRVYCGCSDEQAALQQALYWYLRSDTGQSGVDGGLILMQAALERLAHTFYQPKGRKEPTACWLRNALASRQIPVAVPSGSKALSTYVNAVKKNGVGDAVFAVTKLRNNAVHPKKDSVPDVAYFQAWQQARWFVELMILSAIGYQGSYANRLTRQFEGQVESVPWALPG